MQSIFLIFHSKNKKPGVAMGILDFGFKTSSITY